MTTPDPLLARAADAVRAGLPLDAAALLRHGADDLTQRAERLSGPARAEVEHRAAWARMWAEHLAVPPGAAPGGEP